MQVQGQTINYYVNDLTENSWNVSEIHDEINRKSKDLKVYTQNFGGGEHLIMATLIMTIN